MRRREASRRWSAALTTAVAVALVAGACTGDDDDAADTTTVPTAVTPTSTATSAEPTGPGFTLGFVDPGPGLLDSLINAQEQALKLATEDLDAGGGVLGRPLTLRTAAPPPGGDVVDAMNDLVGQGAQALIGPASSSSARLAIPELERLGLTACSASATAPNLTAADAEGAATPPLFVRTALSDDVLVAFVADTITKRRDTAQPDAPWRVAIMARSDDWGYAVGNGLANSLAARGMVPSLISYNPRTVIFDQQVSQVTGLAPDLIVLASYEEGVPLLASLLRAGVSADRIVGLEGLATPRLGERVSPDDPGRIDGITLIASTGDQAFQQRLADLPGTREFLYAAQAYDCAIVLALAAEAAGSAATSQIVAQLRGVTEGGRTCTTYADCLTKLRAGEDIDYDGPTGRIALDDRGNPTFGRFTVATARGGQLERVESVDLDLVELRRQSEAEEALAAAVFTTRLQQALTVLGFYDGPIDGIFDDDVAAALAAFQASVGLPATGVYDAATDEALRARLGGAADVLTASTADLQRKLAELGYYDGPIDGVYSQAVVDAVKALQRDLGVPETGVIDVATITAIYQRGLEQGTATTTTTAAPTTTVPPTTAAPTTPPPTEPPTTPPPTEPPTTPPPTEPPTSPPTTLPPLPEQSLRDILLATPEFSTFVELLRDAGWNEDVQVPGPLTLFVPTNAAFEALPPGTLDELRNDPDAIKAVLGYHIVEDYLVVADLQTGDLPTVYGAPLAVVRSGDVVTVGGASIVRPDLLASNGVVQGIDAVLIPPRPEPR